MVIKIETQTQDSQAGRNMWRKASYQRKAESTKNPKAGSKTDKNRRNTKPNEVDTRMRLGEQGKKNKRSKHWDSRNKAGQTDNKWGKIHKD